MDPPQAHFPLVGAVDAQILKMGGGGLIYSIKFCKFLCSKILKIKSLFCLIKFSVKIALKKVDYKFLKKV